MKIDPEARSSMWEDLKHGRRTEIDYLQGVITEIAERRHLEVPLSRRIVELIRQAERDAKGSPGLTPEQIRARELIERQRRGLASTSPVQHALNVRDGGANETDRSGADRDCPCRLGITDPRPRRAADGDAVAGL